MLFILFVMLIVFVVGAAVMQICFCAIALPRHTNRIERPSLLDQPIGLMIHGVAYICALARLPFTIGPFLGKRGFFSIAPAHAAHLWHQPTLQLLRAAGEGGNLLLVALALNAVHVSGNTHRAFVVLVISAEVVRLAAHKGQMLVSASWQALPHRAIAQYMRNRQTWLARSGYCRYYHCADATRLRYLRATLRRMVARHPLAARRLAYFHGFRIVPGSQHLRSGHVRDIARGEVFIHRRWTNDPWLLIGLAFRRTPWMFDPRELSRPFAYRTCSNRVMTSFVLRHARFSPTFAWYQFGHEIKAASHDIVLRALQVLGFDYEAAVRADGTYPFEHATVSDQAVLWTDEAALYDIHRRQAAGTLLTVCEIAEQYAYPHCYVVEVLMPRLHAGWHNQADPNAASIARAVASGASQCG